MAAMWRLIDPKEKEKYRVKEACDKQRRLEKIRHLRERGYYMNSQGRKVTKHFRKKPKRARSGYNFFFEEQLILMESLEGEKHREKIKRIGAEWLKLHPDDKIKYEAQSLQER